MEEFVRKDIEKTPNSFFLHAETFYIKGRSVFKKRLGLFKGIPELFITSFSGMDFFISYDTGRLLDFLLLVPVQSVGSPVRVAFPLVVNSDSLPD